MDRIRQRQINARPLLRPAQFFAYHIFHSDSVRIGGGERGKRHEFNVGEIHGTATGNLVFSRLRDWRDFQLHHLLLGLELVLD